MAPAVWARRGPISFRRGFRARRLPPLGAAGAGPRAASAGGLCNAGEDFFATDTNLKVAYILAQSPANYALPLTVPLPPRSQFWPITPIKKCPKLDRPIGKRWLLTFIRRT